MSQIISGITQAKVLNTLDTYNHTALAASMYTVSVELYEIPPSGVTIAIKQGASTIITSAVPAITQNHITVRAALNCAINDVIGVVIASSTASDTGPNAIKAVLNIRQGII